MVYNETEAFELASSLNLTIYYIYLLKKGPAWTPDSTPEIDALQEAHLANFRRLAEMGTVVINGPLVDSLMEGGELRGIGVIKANSLAEAAQLISSDPMARIGRLVIEVHPWMVGRGILP